MFTRKLGRSGIKVSAMGLGCWAIGGPFRRNGKQVGWGEVDDDESIRAIQCAIDRGITFFDTADVYGGGHSERILGQALKGRREHVVIATKFSHLFDEQAHEGFGSDVSPEYIRRACDASLRRLQTDRIDLYQLHSKDTEPAEAEIVRETLEELVAAGKIRYYGWSTDDPDRARLFAQGAHCTAIQQRLNIFAGSAETLWACEQLDLASINRNPLGMGLLTGKFSAATRFQESDVRSHRDEFRGERLASDLAKLDAIRGVLTRDGRTLAQAALGWLWARSPNTIPIPGFKTAAQVEENAAALQRGPLSADQMKEIEGILAA